MIRSLSILICTLVLASAVPASAKIVVGKPTYDPAPNATVTAEAPILFSVRGGFTPPDENGSPWITFVWDFGDGTTRTQRYNGEGVHTDTVSHTFDQGGIYTVTVTGGHGFDFFGFKFQKTHTIKVTVGCPGADPGPKKCAKGTFDPFVGKWFAPATTAIVKADLDLQQLGTKVFGAASIEFAGRLDPVTVTINGKVSSTKLADDVDALQVKFKDDVALGATPTEMKGRLVMPIVTDSSFAYRRVTLNLTAKDGEELKLTFLLLDRPGDKNARLCTAIAAGKRKAKPDDLIAFVIAAQNEGAASIPAYFSGWNVSVSGGTIEDFAFDRAGVRSGNTPSNMTIDFAALGAGKGQNNARAFGFLFVRPIPGANVVTFDTTTFVDEMPADALTIVQPPPLRRVCIPIVE